MRAIEEDRLMSRVEAAKYLGISPHTLAVWHSKGTPTIPVVKIGRLAKYKKTDLDMYIATQTSNLPQENDDEKPIEPKTPRSTRKSPHPRKAKKR